MPRAADGVGDGVLAVTTTGAGDTGFQDAAERSAVDCSVKPAALVGQVKTIFVPERRMVSCGDDATGKVRANTVPRSPLPPQ